ncbi:MAG: DUF2059 domain-containing protein [Rhodobacter sp.]|nr:DUF2059 domain-containing protein [Paracoccaceae bacterium]MCC0077153.1 DUF2059 domain-containing protein [Rhodobacter sp.]
MVRPALALAVSLGLALATPAFAQSTDTYDARLAAARSYIDATLRDLDVAELVRTMYRPVIDQLAASGMQLTQSQIDRIEALYLAEMTQPLLDILNQQDRVMADLFTLEEIRTLAAFYDTPVGRSVMQKLPRVVEAQQPAILGMVQGTMPRLIPQIQAIIQTP